MDLKNKELVIGGFTPMTTIDYPGELAAVAFLQGCPWRCNYCQNKDLMPGKKDGAIRWQNIIDFLQTRISLLDAMVFSGGEPTWQPALIRTIHEVKQMGFKVGIHTAGMYPRRLSEILKIIDWVGMDIKALPDDYHQVTGTKCSDMDIQKSMDMILDSDIDYEFRTTLYPGLTDNEYIFKIATMLAASGVKHYRVQECMPRHCQSHNFGSMKCFVPDTSQLEELCDTFDTFYFRTA